MQCVAHSTCIVFDVNPSCISTTTTPPVLANHNTHPMSFGKQLVRLVGRASRGGGFEGIFLFVDHFEIFWDLFGYVSVSLVSCSIFSRDIMLRYFCCYYGIKKQKYMCAAFSLGPGWCILNTFSIYFYIMPCETHNFLIIFCTEYHSITLMVIRQKIY